MGHRPGFVRGSHSSSRRRRPTFEHSLFRVPDRLPSASAVKGVLGGVLFAIGFPPRARELFCRQRICLGGLPNRATIHDGTRDSQDPEETSDPSVPAFAAAIWEANARLHSAP